MNIFQIAKKTETEASSYEFALQLGLVDHTPPLCSTCGLKTNFESAKTSDGINKRFICRVGGCNREASLFAGSIFEEQTLSLSKSLRLIHLKSMNVSLPIIAKELEIDKIDVYVFLCNLEKKVPNINSTDLFKDICELYNS